MKRAFLEPHDFDEDAMPTLCMVCGGMFDLDDGATNPKKDNEIICEGCAHDLEKEIEKEEEIEELLNQISDAEYTIKDAKEQLHKIGYRFPLKSVCALCGGTGILKGGPTDSRSDEPCQCQTIKPTINL